MLAKAKERILIFGAGGHAKVVIDVIERQEVHQVAFLVDDDPALKGTEFYGYPCIGGKEDLLALPAPPEYCIVAIGSNRARAAVAAWLTGRGFRLASAVHPAAQLARGVSVGAGTVVMAGAVVNSDAKVGENVIINTRASIDHDCVIGDAVHIAPGCTLCGTVTVGGGSFICAGATVIPNLTIGREVTVGAGSAVIRDIGDGVLVAGIPARQLKR